MNFAILGPLELRNGEQPVQFGAKKLRRLIAILLCRANEVVSVDQLLDWIWDAPPQTAVQNLRVYVYQIRRRLGKERISWASPGYRLAVHQGELDAQLFEDLANRGRKSLMAGRPAEAGELLRQALVLWRGEPLSDFNDVPFLAITAARLEELRLGVLEDRIESDLALRLHSHLLTELAEIVGTHPLREGFRAQLMLALYRAGRQAEALEVYRAARRVSIAELGLEPGQRLRDLEQQILTSDPGLDPSAPVTLITPSRHDLRRPFLLPPDISNFTGRNEQLSKGLAIVSEQAPIHPILAITGGAGTGKTTLTVRLAHQVKSRFPDGQLFVDLHGHAGTAVSVSEVVGRFIRALGVAGQDIPSSQEERVELYQSLLAKRRVLIVLDNAASETEIQPMLPGEPGCAVIVTSRTRLGALAREQVMEIDVLKPEESLEMVSGLIGAERVAAERKESKELAEQCGHLALAIRIASARLNTRPHWRVADLVKRLRDEWRRLDELVYGELNMRASIEPSNRALQPPAQRLFRLLSLLDCPDFTVWTAAALIDSSPTFTQNLVDDLVDARLLHWVGRDSVGLDRYGFHNLIRLFAREQAYAAYSSESRMDAVNRAMSHGHRHTPDS
ncbi:BTAD domain-containing putative transcriptional regulator [Nonomuraea sp. NPDC050536]|uniref:AfsR/SARP family transcriptional regulator n=1 Tax=Nonomuraea sp. NPDC050536 TaxID=3364366 RepID=UPI0037C73106